MIPNGLRNRARFVTYADDQRREAVKYHHLASDTEWIEQPMAVVEVGRGLRPGA
jgi:hypothetical protein